MQFSLNEHIGRRIRARRKELRLSLASVAKVLGVTLQAVFKYETGESRIPGHALPALAHTLQVPVGYFFEGSPRTQAGLTTCRRRQGEPQQPQL